MARRTAPSRRSGPGVFRATSPVYWQRRRQLISGVRGPAAQAGQTPVGFGGTSVASKLTAAAGSTSTALTTRAASVKVAAQGGTATLGCAGRADARRLSTPRGASTLGLSGSVAGTAKSVAVAGTCPLALSSRGRVVPGWSAPLALTTRATGITKTVGPVGRATLAATGTGKPSKTVAQGGSTGLGVTAAARSVKNATPVGQAPLAAAGTVWFAARVNGTAAFFSLSSTASQGKTTAQGGRNPIGLRGTGDVRRGVYSRGVAAVGFSSGSDSRAKAAPQRGRLGFGMAGRAIPTRVGPTSGTWTSTPIVLPDDPIAGTKIYWEAATPIGTAVLVHTSVDNGASWQLATSGQPIPRLPAGSSTFAVLLVRISLSRENATDPSPAVHLLEVTVETDATIEEMCPLGVFLLNDTAINDSPAGTTLELSGTDLARKISRNRWDTTFIVEEGTNYASAIQNLVEDRMPGIVTNFASTERTAPRLFFGEQGQNDPWQDAQDLATAIGYELYFDPRGICVLRPEPDPDIHEAQWTFEDEAHPTIVTLSRRVSDADTYNKVIAQGEGSSNDVPVQAIAIDDDPASPTYYLGPYGTVTYTFRSAMITTAEQAQDAADALLVRIKGITESVELSAVPMPALEPGDVVAVDRERSKLEGRFLIDAMSIPLGAAETMRITGRRQRQGG